MKYQPYVVIARGTDKSKATKLAKLLPGCKLSETPCVTGRGTIYSIAVQQLGGGCYNID